MEAAKEALKMPYQPLMEPLVPPDAKAQLLRNAPEFLRKFDL